MGEKLSGMSGLKCEGYLFMLCLELSYMWSSSASMLRLVLFNNFINDLKKKSKFTSTEIANDTKPGDWSQ